MQTITETPTARAARIQTIIQDMEKKRIKITVDNIIIQSLLFVGGTFGPEDAEIINRQISNFNLMQILKKKFAHLSNKALITRINGLPDFKWDDEGAELERRIKASAGKFAAQMQGNKIVILKDEV